MANETSALPAYLQDLNNAMTIIDTTLKTEADFASAAHALAEECQSTLESLYAITAQSHTTNYNLPLF